MSYSVTKTSERCATCANWGGDRSVRPGGTVETSSPDSRGKCYAGVFSSVTQGHRACDGFSCSEYQKWSAIK